MKAQKDQCQSKAGPQANGSDTKKVVTDGKEHITVLTVQEGMISRFNQWLDQLLFRPIDIAPLVYFRIILGAVMLWEIIRYFKGGKVYRYYIQPEIYFKYFGFEWTPGPLPGNLMYLFFFTMGVLYIFMILGLWYRMTSVLLFLGFFYWFYLDMTTYLNHFYLVLLINFEMIFIPAHLNASLDVLRKPELRVAKVPAWTRWLLTLTISIPYFFGAIAKINSDWLQGEPMRIWLRNKVDYPIMGLLFEQWWATYFFSWNGLLYDLIIVPLLLWKRTRVFAIISTIFFHLMNDRLFTIGIFPWFMMFAMPLYFEPEWARVALKFEWIFRRPITTDKVLSDAPAHRPFIKWMFVLYFAVHCIVPFRHHLYPGITNWTEEGYFYSWLMMLRDKNGYIEYTVTFEDTGKVIEIDNEEFLSKLQAKRIKERPEMAVQFAHHLCKHYGAMGKGPVRVNVEDVISLNGRKKQYIIDPEFDLCMAKIRLGTSDWLVPLTMPLSVKDYRILLKNIDFADGEDYVGIRIAKEFGEDGIFFGTVKAYTGIPDIPEERAWRVLFDDGDVEIFGRKDLAQGQYLHHDVMDKDPKLDGSKAETTLEITAGVAKAEL